jgi:regulator of nonsense transcripts 3
VRKLNFEDALNTWNSPALLGPPSVEFAPYGRIPSNRRRTDARQGTIDQDPEFMDFLESLANPVSSKEAVADSDVEGGTAKGEKVTTTPLIQFLKDKKANKGKETAASKAAKLARQDSPATKPVAKSSKDSSTAAEDAKKTPKELKKEKLVEKARQEAVKVINRDAAAKNSTVGTAESSKTPRAHARERGSIAAAARILQRDLGLNPGLAHRKAKLDADNAAKSAEVLTQSSNTTTPSSTATPSKASQTPQNSRPRSSRAPAENERPATAGKDTPAASSPITLLKKPIETTPTPTAPPTAPASMPSKPPQPPARKQQILVPSAGATRAFVKHANPSQGVTEALLKEAMEAFGAVSHVEIDKRKGFAYVDFVDPEGLVKAMAANPTHIEQATVQVLERKDARSAHPPAGPAGRGGFAGRGRGTIGRRGGRGGARGGSEASNVPSGPAASTPPASAPTGPAASVK